MPGKASSAACQFRHHWHIPLPCRYAQCIIRAGAFQYFERPIVHAGRRAVVTPCGNTPSFWNILIFGTRCRRRVAEDVGAALVQILFRQNPIQAIGRALLAEVVDLRTVHLHFHKLDDHATAIAPTRGVDLICDPCEAYDRLSAVQTEG